MNPIKASKRGGKTIEIKQFHHEDHKEHEGRKENPINSPLPLFVIFVSSWFYFLDG
jgi:hypothetical protein